MSAASFKFDDGHRYPGKCFPVRSLPHRGKEGARHWLVSYRKTEEEKYRNLHRRIKETQRKYEIHSGADTPHGKTLDGPFLLQLHRVEKPSELCSVDISEQRLTSVIPEDLKVFDNVAFIDASINSLSLESFGSFVSLRELNLSLNGLRNMTFHAADFPHLEVLDLSYNTLPADDIVSIGQLPHLKVLRLTGNQLHHLPPNLGSSNHDATQQPAKGEDARFKALEVLVLDENKLSSGVFNSLTNLKRLKYLNLQQNRISEIPYLQTSIEEQSDEEGLASPEPNASTDEHVMRKKNCQETCKGSSLPLPELQFLNLAENKIAEEEAVMAAALFPRLRGIDICSNPLTTQRSGDPPFLTHYLQERRGITIKRKKTQEVVKLPLKVSNDPKWKLEERIPRAPKKSLLMDKGKKRGDDILRENSESFFVTQTTDVPGGEFDLQADQEISAENKEKNKDDTIPAKFTSYEMQMEAKSNPDLVEPIGIQTAVQMLEHTLRNLNVYRDSKPQLDCVQTPYRAREKRTKELPPLKPVKPPAERVDEMMEEIKGRATIREFPLSSAIHSTGVNKQEALLLLKEMKTKYQMVHRKAMEQAHSIESIETRT